MASKSRMMMVRGKRERRVADTRSGDDGKTVFQARGCQLGDTAQLSIWWDEKLSRRLSDVRHCPIWLMLLPWPSWVGHTMIEFSFWLVTSHYQFGVNNRSASRRTRGTVYGREVVVVEVVYCKWRRRRCCGSHGYCVWCDRNWPSDFLQKQSYEAEKCNPISGLLLLKLLDNCW